MSEINKFRQQASLESAGSSSDEILNSILERISKYQKSTDQSLIDIGCGKGDLLSKVKNIAPNLKLTGVDYTHFEGDKPFEFFTYDCNKDFSDTFQHYDLTVASEVIEHLENPRHFLRQLSKITASGGHIILSTPNPDSLTSLISLCLRGYHSAFGPKDYPAHITVVSSYDLLHMVNENNSHLCLKEVHFIQNGRIPGSSTKWRQLFTTLKGSRFSDNYLVVLQKI
jgi:2-polyprenyl-3-methyl-5-hydroxy-6-metoxy-1,4-benzoquinol methylase